MRTGSWRPLGDLLTLDVDQVDVVATDEYRIAGVYGFGRGLFARGPLRGSETRYRQLNRLRSSQLVVSRLKAFEGALAVVPDAFDGWYLSPEFPTFRCVDGEIEASYLAHICRWSGFWSVLAAASQGIGARRERVHPEVLLRLELNVHRIDEQRRVADRLDRLQAAATELARRSAHASELSAALVVSLATRPDLDDAAKRRAGWRRILLADVLQLNNREVKVEAGGSYDVAGVYSFGRGMFPRAALEGSQTSYKVLHRLGAGQLVMSRLKAWEGALALVPTELEGWFVSPEFPTFDVDAEQVNPRFLGAAVNSERFWARLKGASQGIGARRERVSASRLLEQEVELPRIEEQKAAAQMIDRIEGTRPGRELADQRIASLSPAALNQAFAGLS